MALMTMRDRLRQWLGVVDPPKVEKVEVANPWDGAVERALEAAEILIACEKRLATDATLLKMCEAYIAESIRIVSWGELAWDAVYGGTQSLYGTAGANAAVRAEMRRIKIRLAESEVARAKKALAEVTPVKKGKR